MTSFSGDINSIPDAPGIEVEAGPAPGELDGPGIPVDISDFGGAPELGLNEFESDDQFAVGEDTVASPVADPASTPPPAASSAPPQLDPTQQMFLGMYQQMQEQGAANQRAMSELVASLRPKQEAPPVDPFADMPPELRKSIDGNPELKAYTEYMAKKAQAPADQFRQDFEKRIEEAKFHRQVDQFKSEAQQVAESVISSGYKLDGTAKQHVHDFLVDTALSLTNARGGSPIQYLEAVKKVFELGVQGRQAHLGEQVKQRVATRPTPQIGTPRAAAPGMVSGQQAGPPTEAEIRQAGYANRTEAIMNGYRKVQQLRARQMGQG